MTTDTELGDLVLRMAGTIARVAADFALAAVDDVECTCADPDGAYPCWYHLSEADRRATIADTITTRIGDVVLDAINRARDEERRLQSAKSDALWAHLFDVHHCNCELP